MFKINSLLPLSFKRARSSKEKERPDRYGDKGGLQVG